MLRSRRALATVLSLYVLFGSGEFIKAGPGSVFTGVAPVVDGGSTPSDQTANALFLAMKAKDYSAAFDMFDARMKAAVSREKLKRIWEAQLQELGSLRSWTITERSHVQGRDIRVATLSFERGELRSTVALDVEKQSVSGFFLRPASPPAPPAPYVNAARFREAAVSVGATPFVLGGTLTVPTQLEPAPGVILVHGSGPHDRDETVGGNRIFKDLAEGLASRGIAVLRYDKRTFRYGDKLGDSISVDAEVVDDAVSALSTLRERPEVNSQRVFVIGHSMGALLAPEIALKAAPVVGLILLAPPGRAPWDVLLSQMRYLGAPEKEIADTQQRIEHMKSGTLGKESLLGAPQSYWKDLGARDGIGVARKLEVPVLILRGDRDYQVTEEDLMAWRKGLAGSPNVEVATIPGLNHLFIVGKGKAGPSEYGTPGHVDGQVIARIASFIESLSSSIPPTRDGQ